MKLRSATKRVHFASSVELHYFEPSKPIIQGNNEEEDEEELILDAFDEEEAFFWECVLGGDASYSAPLAASASPAPKRPLEADDDEATPEHESKRLRLDEPSGFSAPPAVVEDGLLSPVLGDVSFFSPPGSPSASPTLGGKPVLRRSPRLKMKRLAKK